MRLIVLILLVPVGLRADPITVIETQSGPALTQISYIFDTSNFPGPVGGSVQGSARCSSGVVYCSVTIDLTADLYTLGPIRDGVAFLSLDVETDGSAGGAAYASGAIGPYSIGGCPKDLSCSKVGYFPFELGVPFTIHLTGFANANPQALGDGEFMAVAQLQLFEVPSNDGDKAGAPVEIELVPEPSSASLAVTGLFGLV